jgi:hypothetical protein
LIRHFHADFAITPLTPFAIFATCQRHYFAMLSIFALSFAVIADDAA